MFQLHPQISAPYNIVDSTSNVISFLHVPTPMSPNSTLHRLNQAPNALCVRYGWQLERLPSHCACGETLSLNHALSCSKGAMPSIRHNRIRDLLAQFLTEVCPNVAIEPAPQPLTGETFLHRSTNMDNGARLDVKAQNFWDSSSAFFDVRVLTHTHPPNAKHLPLLATGDMSWRREGHTKGGSSR